MAQSQSPCPDRPPDQPIAGRRIVPTPVLRSPDLDGPVFLKDGRPAHLRRLREGDLDAVGDLLKRTSNHSLILRFFGPMARTEQAARLLLGPPARDQQTGGFKSLALAVTIGEPGPESEAASIIAIGNCVRVGTDEANFALLVADDYQGKGLGTLLLERIVFAMEREGIRRMTAEVLIENLEMLGLFRDCGYHVHQRVEHGEVYLTFDSEPTEQSVARAERHDKLSTLASLRPLLDPRSIAVVGSETEAGGAVLSHLSAGGFGGAIHAIDTGGHSVGAIEGIEDAVDLAVIALDGGRVLDAVDACGQAGIRAVAVLAAGFGERGGAGAELDRRLVERVRAGGMRLLGPSSFGLINLSGEHALNASLIPRPPRAGGIAVSSQSGALGFGALDFAEKLGLGFSWFVSVGNRADVSSNDLLQYFEDDPATRLIILYVETFGNPRRFTPLARRISRSKPILALKSGRRGASDPSAALTITAALAAKDSVFDDLFRQSGVVRCETLEELFEVAALFANQPLTPGPRVAVISNARSAAVLCADALAAGGLESVAAVSGAPGHVLDQNATPEEFGDALALALDDDAIHAAIVIYLAAADDRTDAVAEAIGAIRASDPERRAKPLAVCMMFGHGEISVIESEHETIPIYRFPEPAARALARGHEYASWLARARGVIPVLEGIDEERAREICRAHLRERGEGWMGAQAVRDLLAATGIEMLDTQICATAAKAVAAAESIGFPVVLKLASRLIVRKSDFNAVRLGLADAAAVGAACREIEERVHSDGIDEAIEGFIVQRMAPPGLEIALGAVEDPSFGPVIAFGLSGATVEILGDFAFRIAPITDQDAGEMIHEIKGFPLLDGFRGAPPADLEAITELLLRVSRLADEVPAIAELELNPVRVFAAGKGAAALDAKVRLRDIGG